MNGRIMISTNCKLLDKRMLDIIDKINLVEDQTEGLRMLKEYVYETWKHVAWNNELFFIDLSKGKRDAYEKSHDLPAMAIASVYRESTGCMDGYGVTNDVLAKALMPISENGIKIWNSAVLSCRTYQPVQKFIYDLLMGAEVKAQYDHWFDVHGKKYTSTSDGTPAEEIKPDEMTEAQKEVFEQFKEEQQKIIDGKFTEVGNDKPVDEKPAKEVTTPEPAPVPEVREEKPATETPKDEEKSADIAKNTPKADPEKDKPKDQKPADNGSQKKSEDKKTPDQKKQDEKKPNNQKKPQQTKKDEKPVDEKKAEPEKPADSVDLAEKEHPEDDIAVDSITGMPIVVKGFPDMKEGILFEGNKDKTPAEPEQTTVVSPFTDNNREYEQHYPRLSEFSALLAKEGLCCIYHFTVACPACNEILMVEVKKLSDLQAPGKWVLIDPDVLYHNGYNVMTCSANGQILAENFCSLDDHTTVMKIVRGTLNRKDRKALAKNRPSYVRKVYELVDFSGIANHEPLKDGEWKKLLANLNNVINEQNITKRVQLHNYRGPERFLLLCHSGILPMSKAVEAYASILEEGQPAYVIDYNPKYYDTDDWRDTDGNSKNDQYHVFNVNDMKPEDQKREMATQRSGFDPDSDKKTA